MKRRRIDTCRTLAVILTGITLSACPLATIETRAPDPRELAVAGTYIHGPSGMQFPEVARIFRRERIVQYDAEGRSVSVGYDCEEPDRLMAATVYLMPLPGPSFEDELGAVEDAHARFTLEFDDATTVVHDGRELPGRIAGFTYEDTFAHRHGPVSSYLLIYDTPPCRVKWRFTHLPTGKPGFGSALRSLVTYLADPESQREAERR